MIVILHWIKVHVEDMGVNMGLVGHFYNIIECRAALVSRYVE